MASLPHTPTPWTPHNGNARTVASVLSGGSVPVAVFSNATDADFAMLAANSHDDLIATITEAEEGIREAVRIMDLMGRGGDARNLALHGNNLRAALMTARAQ
jgi:hypothetical protein